MKQRLLLLIILAVFLGASLWGAGRVWMNSEEVELGFHGYTALLLGCLLYTSPSPRDRQKSRMPSSA